MRAILAAQRSDEGASSSAGEDTAVATVATRRAVFGPPPAARRPPPQGLSSPLDLVSQLRGDFEEYTREVYGRGNRRPIVDTDEDDPESTLDEMRERRQQERLQLDSLHARLHGLRLILAMAQLNVAANQELERGERVEMSMGNSPDEDGVVLVRVAPSP